MAACRWLIFAGENLLPCAEQLNFGPGGDKPFSRIEHLHYMAPVCRHQAHANPNPAMQVKTAYLRCGHVETTTQFRNQRPHCGPFGLERVDIPEEQIEFKETKPHGLNL